MFSLPDSEQLNKIYQKQQQEWLEACRSAEIIVLGSGIAALTAGLFLELEGQNTLVVAEAENPGGRFTWQPGPVPIVEPAGELLEEVEFTGEVSAPLWVHRTELLAFFVHRYFSAGGEMLSGAKVEKFRCLGDEFELDLMFNSQPLILSASEFIVTTSFTETENNGTTGDTSGPERMVVNTKRREEGPLQAGYQALPEIDEETELPLVNGALLSGRKAAEIILADRID